MDASKAFDRVCHSKLFDVLQAQGMCPLILRALFNMYTHSEKKVRWGSETSKDKDKDKDKEILFQVFKTHRKNM